MTDLRAWFVGCVLTVVFVLASELTVVFREYVYDRLGLSRNLILSMLWLLPVIASFWATFFSERHGVLKSLSLIIVLGLLGPLAHLLAGYLGATIDFAGMSGLKVTVQVYLVLSSLTVGFGTVAGLLSKKLAG